ncbi:hypothetical protein [Phenylobacterium sp.]|uniref:hypothetical protein n=1 Tax=Phenylobacterium sp. TaxID=1871053 RepID=UPI0025F78108|nr:hypothetical protein [Phenylobacterium sp.]MCA3741738.1 hypothetical protein [Phenylobacterium sp.]
MRIAVFHAGRLRALVEGHPTSLAAGFTALAPGEILRDLTASPFAATPFAALAGVSLTDFDDAVRAGGGEPRAPDLRPAFIDLALRHAGI